MAARFQSLGPKPCVVVNGSDESRSWLVKAISVGKDFTTGMCDKPPDAEGGGEEEGNDYYNPVA
eukprot:CAMPEP_0181288104 /NCGR_PEP_ID=MMETSP1101-20121128/148_1 /TAXON_ID=46948 /ORGANISM="Rhodomonas abbreviata, Strain Caron Lab Isolate" /LENGTH=63 /DNA_ID=CAMNT_0023392191 /DNA_START=370 /DNA_END=561 /DNA_ORIENTATION=+